MPVPVRVTLMETLAEMEYTNQQMVGFDWDPVFGRGQSTNVYNNI